ncbi:MAG: DMT family transporter [Rubrobacter sp.]|nr:DMT family transporter [Rubrobacter sp.]
MARGFASTREVAASVPPTGLVVLGVGCFQLGAALAKGLFEDAGPGGTVFLRVAFAALILLVMWRPNFRGYSLREYGVAAIFGLALAAMNFAFYSSLERIPLGVAVTLEFTGPLAVAVVGSRKLLDLVWVILAAGGILLLAPLGVLGGLDLDPVGVALALLAGCFWASYIILSAKTGGIFPGGTGLALAMCIGAVALLPVGISQGGMSLLDPKVLLVGAGVALLSSAIPYSLEMEALRKLPTRVFGVLMSLEPAVAALVGFIILSEALEMRAILAIFLVTAAAVGASRFASKN